MRQSRVRSFVLGFAAFLLLAAGNPAASETIGQVTRTQGQAMAIAGGENRTLAVGSIVSHDETLKTFDDGRLEVKLVDGTVLTLGENATLRMTEMVFNQAGQPNQLALFAEGAFRMITGSLSKSADARVRVNTPVAVLSVRGTDVWGGPIDGAYGVFLLDGEVTVRTVGGEVTLNRPGTGTNILDASAAPGEVRVWPQDKVDRAVAPITFR